MRAEAIASVIEFSASVEARLSWVPSDLRQLVMMNRSCSVLVEVDLYKGENGVHESYRELLRRLKALRRKW